MSIEGKVKNLLNKNAEIKSGGGEKAVAKQKAQGKLFARDRIDALLDKGSFEEIDLFVEHDCQEFGMEKKVLNSDGVITGFGRINGRRVCVFAQDFTVAGGSLGIMHARKITKMMDLAARMDAPLIGINDSGGARIQEGVNSLAGYGEIFFRNTRYSGVIPQISVIIGPCAGGAVYSPALTDFVFTVDGISKMFITGPEVIKTVLGEEITMEELGGARTHCTVTGNAHFIAKDEKECFEQIRKLHSFLPSSFNKKSIRKKPKEPLNSFDIEKVMPSDPKKPFDVKELIKSLVDSSDFLEVQEHFAPNVVVGFARLYGQSIGIVANQPAYMAGVLDVNSSDKAARFVRFCDAFDIPLLTLVDIPGYLPGVDQEYAGVIRHGAKLLYAYSEATVPKLTLILRKAYGGGYIAMCSRHLGADFVYAWPTAEIAVMGPEGAANIIFRAEISAAADPELARREKVNEYTEKFCNPYVAASMGHIDGVIDPAETRKKLVRALNFARNKKDELPKKKHSNIPL